MSSWIFIIYDKTDFLISFLASPCCRGWHFLCIINLRGSLNRSPFIPFSSLFQALSFFLNIDFWLNWRQRLFTMFAFLSALHPKICWKIHTAHNGLQHDEKASTIYSFRLCSSICRFLIQLGNVSLYEIAWAAEKQTQRFPYFNIHELSALCLFMTWRGKWREMWASQQSLH